VEPILLSLYRAVVLISPKLRSALRQESADCQVISDSQRKSASKKFYPKKTVKNNEKPSKSTQNHAKIKKTTKKQLFYPKIRPFTPLSEKLGLTAKSESMCCSTNVAIQNPPWSGPNTSQEFSTNLTWTRKTFAKTNQPSIISDSPVISSGLSMPMMCRAVGTTSASRPPSRSILCLYFSSTTYKGTV